MENSIEEELLNRLKEMGIIYVSKNGSVIYAAEKNFEELNNKTSLQSLAAEQA